MIESIVFMQIEDNMATFERNDGSTIIYPIVLVPEYYKEGHIIKVVIHGDNFIEFLDLDSDEMNIRRTNISSKKLSLQERAKRSTNNA